MALGFTQSIPYTYWKVIASCISAVTILCILIIHIHGYCIYGNQKSKNKRFKNKNSSIYNIANIVTIITISLYEINCALIFLSKFDLVINIISCKIYNDICAANWQIANVAKLSVFILRLDMAFKGSQYAYKRNKLIIFGSIILLQAIINVTMHIITQYGSKYSVHNIFYACQYEVPFYILALANLSDLIASSIMVYLFIKPLKKIYENEKERQMEFRIDKTRSNTDIHSKTNTSHNDEPVSPSDNDNDDNDDDDGTKKHIDKLMKESKTQIKLKKITYKYTVLTFTATFSTLIILMTLSIIGSGTMIVFDYMINAFCLILMSKWYENGNWFGKLCCGIIRCGHFCHALCNDCNGIMHKKHIEHIKSKSSVTIGTLNSSDVQSSDDTQKKDINSDDEIHVTYDDEADIK